MSHFFLGKVYSEMNFHCLKICELVPLDQFYFNLAPQRNLWEKEIHRWSNEGCGPFSREYDSKIATFKNNISQNQRANFTQSRNKAFFGKGNNKFIQVKGQTLVPERGMLSFYHNGIQNILLLRQRTNIKLHVNWHEVKGVLRSSNGLPYSSTRGDKSKMHKLKTP